MAVVQFRIRYQDGGHPDRGEPFRQAPIVESLDRQDHIASGEQLEGAGQRLPWLPRDNESVPIPGLRRSAMIHHDGDSWMQMPPNFPALMAKAGLYGADDEPNLHCQPMRSSADIRKVNLRMA
jgi:hypothetical protein